jgi:adenine-specific DNA-methyltransferase
MKKQKLELTWIGKDERPKLEPRILIEDPEKSYHASKRVGENDIFDNRLIFGDNLLALKALEQEFAGKVKCIYIDPPFNTGQAFDHYDDGVEHSLWLSLMRDRLIILRNLLSETGSIWVHVDDNEAHYLKIMMDEIYGRNSFITTVIWRAADSSNNDAKKFSLDHNVILVYAKNSDWVSNPLERTEEANQHYSNPDNDPRGPWFSGNLSSPNPRPNLRYVVTSPSGHKIQPPANGWRWKEETMHEMIETGEIAFSSDGSRVIKKTYLEDQRGLSPSSLWADIEDTGHNRQAKYELKKLFPDIPTAELFKTPKPERLIKKVFSVASKKGDLVLDSFAGSGTTGAVAHKMGRKWIMIELGEHCDSVILPRMKKIINNEDRGGVSEMEAWSGGGGFRYYRLAPSLLEKDSWGNWVISKDFNSPMLAEAVCKLNGFTYAPSDTNFWQHGHSTERDYIYVTTQTLTREQLAKISEEVGESRSLLICCGAFRVKADTFPNLTLRKIPKAVLTRCEWGRDDYSLKVNELPIQEAITAISEPEKKAPKQAKSKQERRATQGQLGLFIDKQSGLT